MEKITMAGRLLILDNGPAIGHMASMTAQRAGLQAHSVGTSDECFLALDDWHQPASWQTSSCPSPMVPGSVAAQRWLPDRKNWNGRLEKNEFIAAYQPKWGAAQRGLAQGGSVHTGSVEIPLNGPDPERDEIAHALQLSAAVTLTLAADAAGHEIAAKVRHVLADQVCGIALYATGNGGNAAPELVSHSGMPGLPELPAADDAGDSPGGRALRDALKPGAADLLIDFGHGGRPEWLSDDAARLAVVHFSAGPTGSLGGCVLFALRQASAGRALSALLLQVAHHIGDCLYAKRNGDSTRPAPGGIAPSGPIKVLLVDDEPLVVKHVGRLLRQRGFEFHSAQSARLGLELAVSARFDFILIDKILPDMDGIELLRLVRRDERLSTVPVIMLSGYADEPSRIRALRAGADDFIAKPFSPGELVARIEGNVRMAQARRAAIWRESEVLCLRQSQQELRKLLDTIQNVRAEERRLLAREVHDQLGQLLTAAKIDIRLLEEHAAKGQPLAGTEDTLRELRSALSSINLAIEVVQNISILLRPPALERGGLVAALRWQAADFQRRSRISCTVVHDEAGYVEPPPFVAGELFRICQEALTNVLRHAHASSVRICIAVRGRNLLVRVCDDGVGIPPSVAVQPDAIGIAGMRERAVSVRASLHIHGRPGCGTVLSIRR
ncbi:MAG: response regulator, partial [Telluria sp.]